MVARHHCARERQQGSILVAVMVFMALLMLFATTLINHLLVSEAEEVESLLAETRVYWAMNGHLNYMLSRAAAQGLCDGVTKQTTLLGSSGNQASPCNAELDAGSLSNTEHTSFSGRTTGSRVGSLQDYLDGSGELQPGGAINSPGALVWYFPQNANALNVGNVALNDTNVTNTANKYHFAIRGVVNIQEIPNRSATLASPLRIDLYVTDVGDAPVLRNIADRVGRLTVGFCVVDQGGGGSSLSTTTDTSSCTTGKTEGSSSIQFIQRNFSF